jgi:hypothetical protein
MVVAFLDLTMRVDVKRKSHQPSTDHQEDVSQNSKMSAKALHRKAITYCLVQQMLIHQSISMIT